MTEHTKGRLVIIECPDHSPHRMFLRGGVSDGWPQGGFDIYWLQHRKSGAGRGMTPQWHGFDERDAAVMRRLVACWNACEGISTEDLETVQPGETAALADRDELLAALKNVTRFVEGEFRGRRNADLTDGALDRAQALIAKHTPKVT